MSALIYHTLSAAGMNGRKNYVMKQRENLHLYLVNTVIHFGKFFNRSLLCSVLVLVHLKLKNISNISKSTSWFRGWKLTIELTYSRIVNKQLQCVTKFVKALLQGRSACSHFSFIFVSCLSFLFSAFMVSRVSFVSHLSWNSLKVVKIVQTFNFLLVLKYFWKFGERDGV